MGNNIKTLNDQLHDQLARLNSDISGEELSQEIDRAKAMTGIGSVIVNNNKIALDAIKMASGGQLFRSEITHLLGEELK